MGALTETGTTKERVEGETSMEGGGKGTKIRVQTDLSAGHLCHLGEDAPEQDRPRQGCLCCAWLGLT